MRIIIGKSYDELCEEAGHSFADLIRQRPDCVLGLVTILIDDDAASELTLAKNIAELS